MTNHQKTIGISATRFGVSEAFAVFLMRQLDNNYAIRRVDNSSNEEACDVLIGVGDKFDPVQNRFSHYGCERHSLQSMRLLHGYTGPLSTGGLVYAINGKTILKKLHPERNKVRLKYNFKRIFEFFVEVVDCYTFRNPLAYPTNEKEELLKYLDDFSKELSIDIVYSLQSVIDFLSIVDIYSSKIGEKFLEMLNWYYNEYLRLIDELIISMLEMSSVHKSKRIAFCDFDFSNVTLPELLSRVKKIAAHDANLEMAFVLVMKFGDLYRVECLCPDEQTKQPTIAFPVDWPTQGDQIQQFLGISDVRYISEDGMYAIAFTRDAAIAIAIALVEYCEKEGIMTSKASSNSASISQLSSVTNSPRAIRKMLSSLSLTSNQNSCKSAVSPSNNSTAISLDENFNLKVSVFSGEKPLKFTHSIASDKEESQHTQTFPNVEEAKNNNHSEKKTKKKPPNITKSQENNNIAMQQMSFAFVLVDHFKHNNASDTTLKLCVKILFKEVSLTKLNAEIRAKFPDLGTAFGLCHRDSLIPVVSNPVTESPRFWHSHYKHMCFARLSLQEDAKSCSEEDEYYETASSTASTYEDANATLQTLPVESKDNKNLSTFKIGVNLSAAIQSSIGVELLACAIIASAQKTNLEFINLVTNKTDEIKLKIGHPDAFWYTDETCRYTTKNSVSMLALDLLTYDHRMSCAGIAFAKFGLKSIANVLVPQVGVGVCERDVLMHVFQRAYVRLIKSLDANAVEAAENDKNELKNLTNMTPEAQLFSELFGATAGDIAAINGITNEDARLKMTLSVHMARNFYERFVVGVYHQLFSD